MSYDYHTFIHPVPCGTTVPKGTKMRCVDQSPYFTESFFTTMGDFEIPYSGMKTYYMDYDITLVPKRPKLPNKVNSLIYNVHTAGAVYLVAVYRGGHTWSAFSEQDDRNVIFNPEILSFDTTPPMEEAEA